MAKARILARRASLSLRELAESTNISRSTLSRMSDEALQALSDGVENGTRSKNWRPSPRKPVATTNPLLEAINRAESQLISIHFAAVQLAWDDPALRERLEPIFAITRPFVED